MFPRLERCDIGHLYMPLVDELAAIHLVTFCGTVGFRRLKALKSQRACGREARHVVFRLRLPLGEDSLHPESSHGSFANTQSNIRE